MDSLKAYLMGLTSEQLVRFERRLQEKMRQGMGYQRFGYDMRTLVLTRPGLARGFVAVRAEEIRRYVPVEYGEPWQGESQ